MPTSDGLRSSSLANLARSGRYWLRSAKRVREDWRQSVGRFVSSPPALAVLGDEAAVAISEWSVYRGVLRAQLSVTPKSASPTHAYFLFGERAIRFQLAPIATQRFAVRFPANLETSQVGLAIGFSDGRILEQTAPAERALAGDPSSALFEEFLREVRALPPGAALELGARARSGTTYREFIPAHLSYTGLDIVEGPNVDIVGDVHDLPPELADGSFGLVFSIAVFEHLAMPWKAALSINRVLSTGGLVFVGTHQTFPVHEAPWDFWRYSDRAWHSLFNRATGFEIIRTALGQPADIVPHATLASVTGIDNQPAYLTSSVLARKIGPPSVSWDVRLSDLDDQGVYPH